MERKGNDAIRFKANPEKFDHVPIPIIMLCFLFNYNY